MTANKKQPTWTDLKGKLAELDRQDLLNLIKDLYVAHKDNQTFLHARFATTGAGTSAIRLMT